MGHRIPADRITLTLVPTSWLDAVMWGRKAEFRDDRGKPARLLGASPFRPAPSAEDATSRREVRRSIGRRTSPADIGCLALFVGYICLLAFSGLITGTRWPKSGTLLTAAFFLAAGLLWTWSAARVNNSRGIARDLIAKGLCPQCGYSFAGVQPQEDGCVVCPECEAAWRT
jgi:hypothetical protein